MPAQKAWHAEAWEGVQAWASSVMQATQSASAPAQQPALEVQSAPAQHPAPAPAQQRAQKVQPAPGQSQRSSPKDQSAAVHLPEPKDSPVPAQQAAQKTWHEDAWEGVQAWASTAWSAPSSRERQTAPSRPPMLEKRCGGGLERPSSPPKLVQATFAAIAEERSQETARARAGASRRSRSMPVDSQRSTCRDHQFEPAPEPPWTRDDLIAPCMISAPLAGFALAVLI